MGSIENSKEQLLETTDKLRQENNWLKMNKELFTTFLDSTMDWIIWRDHLGQIVYISPACEQITGYLPEEITTYPDLINKIIYPGDKSKWLRMIDESGTKDSNAIEVRIVTKSGKIKWLSSSYRLAYDKEGNFLGTRLNCRDITTLKEIEETLRDKESRLRLIADNMLDLVNFADARGKLLYVSPSNKTLLGHNPEEMIGKNFFDFTHPDETETVARKFWDGFLEDRNEQIECRFRHAQGHYLWMSTSANLVFDQSGKILGVVMSSQDITARKQAEEALRKSEASLAEAQRIAKLGNWNWDINSDQLTWSDEIFRIAGLNRQDFPDITYHDFVQMIHPEDRDLVTKEVNAAIEGNKNYSIDHRLVLPDGSFRYVHEEGTVIKDEQNRPIRMIGTVQDITERREAEENLRKLSLAVENSPVSVAITNEKGQIEYINPKFTKVSGFTMEEAVGKRIIDLLNEKVLPESWWEFWEAIRLGKEWQGELQSTKKNGELMWELVSISAIKSNSGQITNFITVREDITQRKKLEETNNFLAFHDPLTGLPNRRNFTNQLGAALADAARGRQKIAVMFLDLDQFKIVNDSLGHNAGDFLLQAVAGRLKESLQDNCPVFRLGGDEFTIIVKEVYQLQTVIDNIISCLDKPFALRGRRIFITTSIGVSIYPDDGTNIDTLIRNADAAMYRAKSQGRNKFQLYTADINKKLLEQLALENDLRQAISRNEILVYYQPQFDLLNGRITGAEALVRWQHHKLGLVSPGEFIPLAEDTGLIVPIGNHVLWTACTQAKQWQEAGFPELQMAVNISINQLMEGDFVSQVEQVLAETGLEPKYLDLEVTESVAMHDINLVIDCLVKLSKIGVKIAIDDFGTGYSSLNNFRRLPVNKLKIDMSFISGIPTNQKDTAIVNSIIAMARSLQLDLVAEGVETKEQQEYLAARSCGTGQGYLFSKPVPAEQLVNLLEK